MRHNLAGDAKEYRSLKTLVIIMLNKHGLSVPPCLIVLSMGIPLTFVSWKQMSYLPPMCSLITASASIGAMSIFFNTRLRLSGETLPEACFTSIQQAITPSSPLHSCAPAAIGRDAVAISVALLPFLETKGVDVLPPFMFSYAPHHNLQQNGETSTVPVGQHTLNTNTSRLPLQTFNPSLFWVSEQ